MGGETSALYLMAPQWQFAWYVSKLEGSKVDPLNEWRIGVIMNEFTTGVVELIFGLYDDDDHGYDTHRAIRRGAKNTNSSQSCTTYISDASLPAA